MLRAGAALSVPRLPCSWLGPWDGPWLAGPALMDPRGAHGRWAPGSPWPRHGAADAGWMETVL